MTSKNITTWMKKYRMKIIWPISKKVALKSLVKMEESEAGWKTTTSSPQNYRMCKYKTSRTKLKKFGRIIPIM